MNIDIERLKHDREYWDEVAKPWATHFDPFLENWLNYKGGWLGTIHISDDSNVWRTREGNPPTGAIPRPAKQWSGDGLPPVGCVAIGYMPSWREERECRVVAHEDNSCVVVYGIGLPESWSTLAWCDTFRPLKSEKDRVVEAAESLYSGESDPRVMHGIRIALETAYDAGALKMPEGDEEWTDQSFVLIEPETVNDEYVTCLLSALLKLPHATSYNQSYCGEPEGALKRVIREWLHGGADSKRDNSKQGARQ